VINCEPACKVRAKFLTLKGVWWQKPDPAPGGRSARQLASLRMREAAARAYLDDPPPSHRPNGDEERYADQRASFAKTLPPNDAGEVDAEAFATFVSVLSRGDPSGFETIPRDRQAEVDLNDPQATYAFELVGLDSAATRLGRDSRPASPTREDPAREIRTHRSLDKDAARSRPVQRTSSIVGLAV